VFVRAMLIVDGDHGQPQMMTHVAGKRLEISNDQLNLPLFNLIGKELNALCALPHRKQIPG